MSTKPGPNRSKGRHPAAAFVSGSLPYEVANADPGDTIVFALSPSCSLGDHPPPKRWLERSESSIQ